MTSMFKGPTPTPTPTVTPPPPMPDPMAPDALAARRTAMLGATKGGRSSTRLTTPANTAAAGSTIAGSYNAEKL